MRICVNEISRTVGHINLDVEVGEDGIDARISVLNDPRFIEALTMGREYFKIPEITSRICGPCSISHTIAPITALEKAIGVEVSDDVRLLRETAVLCEIVENHVVHLYVLTLPDYMGYRSTMELARKHPEILRRALALKATVTQAAEALTGRLVHPNACVVGGFTRVPSKGRLEKIRGELKDLIELAVETADLFMDLEYPELTVDGDVWSAVYGGYTFIGDKLVFSDGNILSSSDYDKAFSEQAVPYSTSKIVTVRGLPVYVGARARLNLRWSSLSDLAKEYVKCLRLPLRNPYDNVKAQAIEVVHCLEKAIENLDHLVDTAAKGIKALTRVRIKGGEGVGVKEAPRGILIHHYRVSDAGIVTYANVITPTTINSGHVEAAAERLVEAYREKEIGIERLRFDLERLIRAYDPCLGCATHTVRINIRGYDP